MKKRDKSAIKVIIAFFILGVFLFAFGIHQDRYEVSEQPSLGGEVLDASLRYPVEFCAMRLTELIEELHFVQEDIEKEKEVLSSEEAVLSEERQVLALEMREVEDIRAEFDKYKDACDSFAQSPSSEVCSMFLESAQNDLDSVLSELNNEDSAVKRVFIRMTSLRESRRIYDELATYCGGLV